MIVGHCYAWPVVHGLYQAKLRKSLCYCSFPKCPQVIADLHDANIDKRKNSGCTHEGVIKYDAEVRPLKRCQGMRCKKRHAHSRRRHLTPMPVEYPCILLAFLAAIFGAATTPTLGELARTLFPSAALIVCALSNATSGVVLSAKIPHDYAGPVLHIRRVVTNSEFLHKRENVEVIRQEVFLIFLTFSFGL